jgi:hypothetical protein
LSTTITTPRSGADLERDDGEDDAGRRPGGAAHLHRSLSAQHGLPRDPLLDLPGQEPPGRVAREAIPERTEGLGELGAPRASPDEERVRLVVESRRLEVLSVQALPVPGEGDDVVPREPGEHP